MLTNNYRKSLSILIFSLILSFQVNAQYISEYIPIFQIGNSTQSGEIKVCEGETVSILICRASLQNRSKTVGGLNMVSGVYDCSTQTCNDLEEIEPNVECEGLDNVQVYRNINPNMNDCVGRHVTDSIVITITPTENTVLSIDWEAQQSYQNCNSAPPNIYRYSRSMDVVIVSPPTPNLTTDNNLVVPQENYTLSINNCEEDYKILIKENCQEITEQDYYNNNFMCNTSPVRNKTYVAPNYTTSLDYQSKFYTFINNKICESDWSNNVNIEVQEQPNPNACNNEEIEMTEADLNNPEMVDNRNDYHYYSTETIICNTDNNTECSVESVWNKIKSDISYQIPLLKDFEPIRPYYGFQSLPSSGGFTNCDNSFIAATYARAALSYGAYLVDDIDFVERFANINVAVLDPVKIVIDESSKCITNYTLPGHILHNGKVRRCVVLDNCNEVKVITIGTGFNKDGEDLDGIALARFNEYIGKKAFKNVSERLKIDCN